MRSPQQGLLLGEWACLGIIYPAPTHGFAVAAHLTPAGESAFNQWLLEPVRLPREMRLDFMLKLYFALEEESPVVGELIRRQQEVCAEWLASQRDKDVTGSAYLTFVRRYRYGHIESIQNWLTALANELAGHQNLYS